MALTRPKLTQLQSSITEFDDPIIELNASLAGANTNDLGVIMNRGTTGDNVGILWDRTAGEFVLVQTTADGDSSGDLTFSSYADLKLQNLTADSLATANYTLPTADGSTDYVIKTDGGGNLSWVEISSLGGVDLGEYTVAGLPSASAYPNCYALATDASGGRTIVRSDGTNWKIVVVEGATVTT